MSITGEGAAESAAFADAMDLGRVLIILRPLTAARKRTSRDFSVVPRPNTKVDFRMRR
jgi:hypothetical protein